MPSSAKSPEVDAFIADSTHPVKNCMQPIRDLIHQSNKNITEQIKWKCPSFCFEGDDRITFNLSKKDQLLLIFHTGATGKGQNPDKSKFSEFSLFEWLAPDRGVVKINSLELLQSHAGEIHNLVTLWLSETRPV